MSEITESEKDKRSRSEPRAEDPRVLQERYIHSDIYERLVVDRDDLAGLVAYGLYQSEKRRWISQFQQLRNKLPSEEEVKAFCFTYNDDRLSKLQKESEELIFKVTEERIADRTIEIAHDAFNVRTVEELNSLRSALREVSGYRHHIFAHLLSFAILVGLYYFITFAATHEPSILGWAHQEQPEQH
jgi:hypothetical protein